MAESVARLGRFQTASLAIVTAGVCYLAGRIADALVITTPQTLWPYWPGCAALVAILLITPTRIWRYLVPAGILGFILYDFQTGVPLRSIIFLAIVDVGEVLVAADRLYDFGPGAGRFGGNITAEGTPKELLRSTKSLTGQYLSGRKEIAIPKRRRMNSGENPTPLRHAKPRMRRFLDPVPALSRAR